MALFPKVEFDILVNGGAIVPGRRSDAILVVKTAREIPRAEHIVLAFRSTLFLTDPPHGDMRRELRREIFAHDIRIELPQHVLESGTTRLPFPFVVPAWLPPAFIGNGISVTHDVEATLDVDWAIDPHAAMRAVVEPPPQEGRRAPLTARTPRDFHPSIILEITLDSRVIVHGAPVQGTVRIVGGAERDLEGVELSLASTVTLLGSQVEPRRSVFDSRLFVVGADLAERRAVPFEVPIPPFAPPSFENSILRHELALVVRLIRARVTPRAFGIPVQVLPKGSFLQSDSPHAPPLGRLRRWGIAISNATDLLPGTGDLIAHGAVGPVQIRIREAPGHLRTGLDITLEVPGEPPGPPEGVAIIGDDDASVVDAARGAVESAKTLGKAIAEQPFPTSLSHDAQEAWRSAASGAFLNPSGPSIHGLVFPLRLLGNEERLVPVDIRTIRPHPHIQITLDLRTMPLPESAIGPLQNGHIPEALGNVRSKSMPVSANGDTLTLTQSSWTGDPRTLFPAIDAVLDWVLGTRGERRAIGAYR